MPILLFIDNNRSRDNFLAHFARFFVLLSLSFACELVEHVLITMCADQGDYFEFGPNLGFHRRLLPKSARKLPKKFRSAKAVERYRRSERFKNFKDTIHYHPDIHEPAHPGAVTRF